MELVERATGSSLFAIHAGACAGRLPEPARLPPRVHGKAIVFARRGRRGERSASPGGRRPSPMSRTRASGSAADIRSARSARRRPRCRTLPPCARRGGGGDLPRGRARARGGPREPASRASTRHLPRLRLRLRRSHRRRWPTAASRISARPARWARLVRRRQRARAHAPRRCRDATLEAALARCGRGAGRRRGGVLVLLAPDLSAQAQRAALAVADCSARPSTPPPPSPRRPASSRRSGAAGPRPPWARSGTVRTCCSSGASIRRRAIPAFCRATRSTRRARTCPGGRAGRTVISVSIGRDRGPAGADVRARARAGPGDRRAVGHAGGRARQRARRAAAPLQAAADAAARLTTARLRGDRARRRARRGARARRATAPKGSSR